MQEETRHPVQLVALAGDRMKSDGVLAAAASWYVEGDRTRWTAALLVDGATIHATSCHYGTVNALDVLNALRTAMVTKQ